MKIKLVKCLVSGLILMLCKSGLAQNNSDLKTPSSPVKSVNVQNLSVKIKAEIADMERNAKALWAHATTIDDWNHIGTMYNEVDSAKHFCYVLGRFLGYPDLVNGLRPNYKPDFSLKTHENGHELRVISTSMTNYASAARQVLTSSESERITAWNLDCPGRHGIPKVYADQNGQKPLFKIEDDGTILRVLGDIEGDFSTKLNEALQKNPKVRVVALGSGGGSVTEALRAGLSIRTRGLETTLWNSCYSACPLVLLGGVRRTVMSPYYELGFHQISLNGRAIPLDSDTYRAIYDYANRMGVDGVFVVESMWAAPPESMKVFTTEEVLCETKVMTWIQRACSSG